MDFLHQQLDDQYGFADALVRLLLELPGVGLNEVMQTATVFRVGYFLEYGDECPQALGPSSSHPNSWPVASAFVAVLQSPAVSAECKGEAA